MKTYSFLQHVFFCNYWLGLPGKIDFCYRKIKKNIWRHPLLVHRFRDIFISLLSFVCFLNFNLCLFNRVWRHTSEEPLTYSIPFFGPLCLSFSVPISHNIIIANSRRWKKSCSRPFKFQMICFKLKKIIFLTSMNPA